MKNDLSENSFFNKFINITEEFNQFKKKSIPLCAAENAMSDFVRLPLSSSAQEKYVMGGLLGYPEDNFIGGEYIYPYYDIINKQCERLFHSSYADSRTLTGMNSVTTLLMSITDPGDTIAISVPDCGGHASIPDICHRLGLKVYPLPYDYDALDFDYNQINDLLKKNILRAILFSTSDIVNPVKIELLNNIYNIPIIYDATQTLGLISGGNIINPLDMVSDKDNFILMGATHKTLPGPSCSLIMTKNLKMAELVEEKINPMYIRNTQMHQNISLIFTLLEQEYFGNAYGCKIIENAQSLSNKLTQQGICVLNGKNNYTQTHQIFITCSLQEMNEFYDNCCHYNITLNYKTKRLFGEAGIRIGTQEISRYNWTDYELNLLAEILVFLMKNPQAYLDKANDSFITDRLDYLISKKEIGFTFTPSEYEKYVKQIF